MRPTAGFLAADWPAPSHIRAGTTLRTGGVSVPPYDSLNLGAHTGDDPRAVAENRRRVIADLALPGEPVWLDQVHSAAVADADRPVTKPADASVASGSNTVCAVLSADCVPVLLCDRSGSCWGAAHAGWRGLAAGVLEATVARLSVRPSELMAWLGPAIGAHNFEVGADVRDAFCTHHSEDDVMFTPTLKSGKYLADIEALAFARLCRAGVDKVYGSGLCTIDNAQQFYSHRRGSPTGRMASLIWSIR